MAGGVSWWCGRRAQIVETFREVAVEFTSVVSSARSLLQVVRFFLFRSRDSVDLLHLPSLLLS